MCIAEGYDQYILNEGSVESAGLCRALCAVVITNFTPTEPSAVLCGVLKMLLSLPCRPLRRHWAQRLVRARRAAGGVVRSALLLSRWPLPACYNSANYCALTARPDRAVLPVGLVCVCTARSVRSKHQERCAALTRLPIHPSIHRCVRNSNLRFSPVLSVDGLSKHRKIRFGCGTLFIPVHSLTMGETVGL